MRRTSLLLALALLSLASAEAGRAAPQTSIKGIPTTPPPAGQPGFMMVGDHALAFVPKQAAPGHPVPLLILFHGAGGAAQNMMKPFLHEADRRGIAMLAIQARGLTWDVIGTHFAQDSQEASMIDTRNSLPAGDRRTVDNALSQMTKAIAVDPATIGVLGISDGAAYALSYGAYNYRRVHWIGAIAPAFGLIPNDARGSGSRLFLAHGKKDNVITPSHSSDEVCPQFRRGGWTVRFHSFDGGHELDPAVALMALDDWLDPASRPPADSPEYRCGK